MMVVRNASLPMSKALEDDLETAHLFVREHGLAFTACQAGRIVA